jgi:hypothetical protein
MTSLWLSFQPLARVAPWIVLTAAATVFPLLFFVTAPYGRHFRPGWGPALGSRSGWVAMEWPAVLVFAVVWMANPQFDTPMVMALGILWLLHYLQRTFVFSLLLRDSGKRQPVLTVALANVFNVLNATGNAAALTARPLDASFLAGAGIFARRLPAQSPLGSRAAVAPASRRDGLPDSRRWRLQLRERPELPR